MTKLPTTVRGGKLYGVARDGELHEIDPGVRPPDVWICRRVADFPGGVLPVGAARASCERCELSISYDPARAVTAPKRCMQCCDLTPDPMDS